MKIPGVGSPKIPKGFPVADTDSLRRLIRQCCDQFAGIDAAYLFGSRAGDAWDVDSDVDVALLIAEGEEQNFDLLSFIVQLERTTRLAVDAVILNRAGEELKFQIRSNGVLIYEKNSVSRKNFEMKSRKSYEDYLYLHKRYVKSVLYGDT